MDIVPYLEKSYKEKTTKTC